MPGASEPRGATASASLPGPITTEGGLPDARIAFAGDLSDLPGNIETSLRGIVTQLRQGGENRLRIEGYASGDDANRARRLSLTRALSIRAYLMEQGLASTRMDVYARGNQAPGGAVDRVDLTVFRR
jgi:outer membrane protein OmpA-like peptidoglycan-associated protein